MWKDFRSENGKNINSGILQELEGGYILTTVRLSDARSAVVAAAGGDVDGVFDKRVIISLFVKH